MTDPTTDYACKVLAGELPAGPNVRDACARHLRDLQDGPKRGLRFDVDAANRAISFYPAVLRLNGGEFEGVPFELLPWQKMIIGSLFGWKGPDGFRRFRMAFVLTGKGSGKSPLAAGVGLYCMAADNEPRAEIYAAATMKEQAQVLFRDAVAMVKQSPKLGERLSFSGGNGREYNIAYTQTSSFFRVLASGDGQSGPRPHCGLLDEIHEHRDNSMVELIRAGTKGRRQAIIFAITNAEADRTGVCAQLRDYAARVGRGELKDDAFFSYIAALDDGDDPMKDESCWAKANPSLGHTFQMKYLHEQVTQARGMPAKEAIVRRLHFCQPTDAAAPWIDNDLFDAAEARGADVDLDSLRGLPCYAGLDLSMKRDLTALSCVWRRPDGSTVARTWFWSAADTLDDRARTDNVPYRAWLDGGHIFAPPGRTITKDYVALFVKQLADDHDLRGLAFDQHLIDDFVRECDNIGFRTWIDDRKRDVEARTNEPEGDGLRMVRHGQGWAGAQSSTVLWMNRSISGLEDQIIGGTVDLVPNPCLRWNSASAYLEADASANRKWSKKKSTGRIDGMVALAMAHGLALAPEPAPAVSIWDMPEVWD